MVRRLTKTRKRRSHCTLGDLWKCLSVETPDTVGPALLALNPSRDIARKMLADLTAAGKKWDALTLYAKERAWLEPRGRWRDHQGDARHGEVRQYTVQESEKRTFVRVPVEILKVTRGQPVVVTFTTDSVVIQKQA